MFGKTIYKHLWSIFPFLILISLVHWQLKFSLIFFWLGVIIGTFLLHLDQAIYCFFQSSHEFSSQRIKRLWEQKDYRGAVTFLLETQEEREKLVFHSVLFQFVLLVASFFVLTSSASLLGKGVVMGLFLQSLIEQGRQLHSKGEINNWFWQLRAIPAPRIQVFYFLLLVLVFILLVVFLV